MIVGIASGVIESLQAEATAAHPAECCGLLTGTPGHIEAHVPARNTAANPARNFEIDPAVLLATHRNVRAQNRRVLGHYHSHPDAAAQPSVTDAARAVQNGQLWLVIAAGHVTAWEAVAADTATLHGRFRAVQLQPA